MRVAVIGAGGIGSLFGGRLAAAGHAVWLVHRRQEHVDALQRHGLLLENGEGAQRIRISATTRSREIGPVDLVLIATKTLDTAAAAEAAHPLVDDHTTVLTVQNGLGNFEVLAERLGAHHILVGMTYAGATLLGPGHARHTAPGQTFIGEPDESRSARIEQLAHDFTSAGLPTEATEQLWSMVWGKLLINAALNATSALMRASGSDILASEPARRWAGLVADETAAVAAALGVNLPYADPAARVLRHCEAVGDARTSMLQDIEHRRPTEVDAINGAVVREGARVGVPTPFNMGLLLLVKGLEDVARRAQV